MAFALRSSAFAAGQPIPIKYTQDGDNISPPLEWSDAPPETQSFMLVVDDPDAPSGTFRHWGLYNIMPERTVLPEALGRGVKTEDLGLGVNDFGSPRYDGPAPPRGHGPHRYRFRLAALDLPALSQSPKLPVGELFKLAAGHIIAEAELVGTYAR